MSFGILYRGETPMKNFSIYIKKSGGEKGKYMPMLLLLTLIKAEFWSAFFWDLIPYLKQSLGDIKSKSISTS
jgi:hypothetical protein